MKIYEIKLILFYLNEVFAAKENEKVQIIRLKDAT